MGTTIPLERRLTVRAGALPRAVAVQLTVSQSDAADGTGPPFLADAARFIRQQPTPWTESTKKFVAFMFGVASHQVRAAQSGADGAQRL